MTKVVVRSAEPDFLEIYAWSTNDPDAFLEGLAEQLRLAQALWPQLKEYQIVQRRSRSKAKGTTDGD